MMNNDSLDRPVDTPTTRRRRPWIALSLLVLVPLLLLLGGWAYLRNVTGSRLDRAIAAAERSEDPAWRLADLNAARAKVPDAENSALRVAAVRKALPDDWMTVTGPVAEAADTPGGRIGAVHLKLGEGLEPNEALSDAETESLRKDLAALEPTLSEARTLADLPQGRWPMPDLDAINQMTQAGLDRVTGVREVARLLQLDAVERAHSGDIAGALDDVRAMLNTGRSLGDEPLLMSQLVRIAIESVSVATLERVLALGEADEDASLARIQELLADEAAVPVLVYALRGERAAVADTFSRLTSGEVSLAQLATPPGSPPPARKGFGIWPPRVFYVYNQALALELMNRALSIARRPLPEQQKLWNAFDAEIRQTMQTRSGKIGVMVYLIMPAVRSVGEANLRSRAMLNVAQTMVAMERYRLAHDRWPDALELLSPDFLKSVPPDPYTGEPIRFARTTDGLIVYSRGPDGEDDGGQLDPRFQPDSTLDFGLRLWDPDKRRQPAQPTEEPAEPPAQPTTEEAAEPEQP